MHDTCVYACALLFTFAAAHSLSPLARTCRWSPWSSPALLEKWLTEDKVTCSEQLGDMVLPLNPKLALSVYLRAGDAHEKVVQCLLATGEFAKIVPYCTKAGYRPNFLFVLQTLAHSNPKAAQEFAVQLVKNESGGGVPLIEIPPVIDVLMQFQRLQVRVCAFRTLRYASCALSSQHPCSPAPNFNCRTPRFNFNIASAAGMHGVPAGRARGR